MAIQTTHDLLDRCSDDPWTLGLSDRRRVLAACREEQACWLPLLSRWVEPPSPMPDFPAFLLALPGFAPLRAALQDAELAGAGAELDTGTRDELQRFVDAYRQWLTECEADGPWLSTSERDRCIPTHH